MKNQYCRLLTILPVILLLTAMSALQTSPAQAGSPGPTPPSTETPGFITWTVASNISEPDLAAIKRGIHIGQEYLDVEVDGGIPAKPRIPLTISVIGTGLSPFCCITKEGFMAFDIRHQLWKDTGKTDDLQSYHWQMVAHEYMHAWQHELGCQVANDPQPLGEWWFVEGMAEYMSWRAATRAGLYDMLYVSDGMMQAIAYAPMDVRSHLPYLGTMDSYDGFNYAAVLGVQPYAYSFLAIDVIVQRSKGDVKVLRRICQETARGMSLSDALKTEIGETKDEFIRVDFPRYMKRIGFGVDVPESNSAMLDLPDPTNTADAVNTADTADVTPTAAPSETPVPQF
jgi:hypothetical protein